MNEETVENCRNDEMWSVVDTGSAGEGSAPCARGKHSATLLGGHLYVLGGRGAGGNLPLRDFWRYSLESGEWSQLECRGQPPPWLQEHSCTAHDGKLYVFGGEAGALSTETPLWIYDTETRFWRKLPGSGTGTTRRGAGARTRAGAGAPRGRRGHSAHALKDCLLIYGGYKDLRGSTNELWAFHYESESWQAVRTQTAGPARHRHAAALHDARLIVHAGQCDLRACADLWMYDTLSRVWSCIRPAGKAAPGPRAGHAAARAGGALYIFGGEADGHPTNDMWRFHIASEMWERILPSLKWPAARVDACTVLLTASTGAAGFTDDEEGAPTEPTRAIPPGNVNGGYILREISRLSSFHMRRAARCAYTALGERDSRESLPRDPTAAAALGKSVSAHALSRRGRGGIARSGRSVPDFGDSRASSGEESGAEVATSGYGSAERLGFSNPHYEGGGDIELQELGTRPARPSPARRLLLVGGREAPHVARLQSPLSMWTYRLL